MTSQPGTSRRGLLAAGGAGLAASVLGAVAVRELHEEPSATVQAPSPASSSGQVNPHGPHQAGVHLPSTPPAHLSFHVFEAGTTSLNRQNLQRTLADLGNAITTLTTVAPTDVRQSAAADELTVQVGLGPRAVALTEADVALTLPEFAGSSAIPARLRRGDIVIAVAARHPETTAQASDVIASILSKAGFRALWGQLAFRPRGNGSVALNPLGFDDGIVQPEATQGIPDHVFLTDGVTTGGTIGVVRRFVLDTASFAELDTADQEAVFGRVKATGAPLSGGTMFTDVNVGTKTPEGHYLIPVGSHVRATHPSFTGSTLMLRRSYGFRESADGGLDRSGLLFMSFQDDVQVFARTQLRMDREDRLMDFATPTAEVAFLVLPGFTPSRPLGASLFATTGS